MALLRIVDIMFRYREHNVIPAVVSSVRCAKTLHKWRLIVLLFFPNLLPAHHSFLPTAASVYIIEVYFE